MGAGRENPVFSSHLEGCCSSEEGENSEPFHKGVGEREGKPEVSSLGERPALV